MLIFLGDIHGFVEILWDIAKKIPEGTDAKIIQVGDFGFWPSDLDRWNHGPKMPFPIYAIDGNHEYFPLIRDLKEVTDMGNNLHYVPRGTILTLDNTKIGFMGGAHSVDKAYRHNGVDWFKEEEVTMDQIKSLQDQKVDLLVTHSPPHSIIQAVCGPLDRSSWGLPPDWRDDSARAIEVLWNSMNRPPLICGHIHRSATIEGVRVLNINETWINYPNKGEQE